MEVPGLVLKAAILSFFFRISSGFPLAWHITCFRNADLLEHDHQLVRRDVSVDPPKIASILVDSAINTRFVSTTIKKEIVNSADVSQNVTFRFQLPAEAFISDFMMIIDNVRYQAEVKPKEEAQRDFDEAIKKGQNAGQVKQSDSVDSTTDEFEININVSPNTNSVFLLQFQELLHRKKGVLQHKIHLSPGEVVDNVEANICIKESQGFSSVDITWEQEDEVTSVNHLEKVTPSEEIVSTHFSPSPEEQERASDVGLNGHLNVVYDVIHDQGPGDIQIHNGYFVHHISPEGIPITRKNVIFVIDVSGSMSGDKLTQTKSALNTIIGDVREFDMFNIITFSSSTNTWKKSLVSATSANKEDALEYVHRLEAGGGTNLYEGLVKAVNLFEAFGLESSDAFSMIIMLTDGDPTSGVTDRDQIVSDITERIQKRIALFCLGFGSDVDSLFLERLAVNNEGVYKKISVTENASDQLTGFYDEVASPLLFNVDIEYTPAAVDTATLTQSSFISYFQGQELVVSGKLNPSFTGNELVATVMGNSLNERVNWQLSKDVQDDTQVVNETSCHVVSDFAERLWAYLTIKDLLVQSRVTMSESEREEFQEKALNMSLHYRFVTPLTSLVIIQQNNNSLLPLLGNSNQELQEDSRFGSRMRSFLIIGGDANFLSSSNRILCFCLAMAWVMPWVVPK